MHSLLDVTAAQARNWQWPPDILPLSPERHPFRDYSDDAIQQYFRFLAFYPEAYGRLGRFVRTKLGVAQPCPTRFVLREAHIDISDADQELANFLLCRGFEPDHFLSLNPPEYTKCFTARFEIPAEHPTRSRAIAEYMLGMMLDAERKVSEHDGIFAYSEIECYTHRNKKTFEFRPVDGDSLGTFPFAAGQFVPASAYPKKWDIHVKLPSRSKGSAFDGAECPAMLRLRQLFLMSGFYEIRSLSGNLIYTLQLMDGRDAKRIFVALADWASMNGGITAIEMEACARFWRSEATAPGNRLFVAPTPKIVRNLCTTPTNMLAAS